MAGTLPKSRTLYWAMLPGLTLAGLFTFYPIVAAFYFALHEWSGFNSARIFVALDNFKRLLVDPFFWGAFKRSLVFLLGTVPLQMFLSLVVAVILNNKLMKLSGVFRTFIFLPVVTPVAVIGIVWTFLLSPFNGPINGLLLDVGFISRPIDFLGSGDTVMPSLIAVYVWKWLGLTMIYWMAALQTVPDDVYEAAKLDNCQGARLLWFIILPIIRSFALVILLISSVSALNVFPLIMSMTNGGPFFSSEVIEIFIYRSAFATAEGTRTQLGYAAAAGVMFGMLIITLTLIQTVASRRMRRK